MSAGEERSISAWAAETKGAKLARIELPIFMPLGADEVEIEVHYSAVCHSDIHLVDGDWGPASVYPLVPGHEIVGVVLKAGIDVTNVKKGEFVGVGWQRNSCGACEACMGGNDNVCLDAEATCAGGNPGGFASLHITKAKYCFPLPKGMDAEKCAPLLCGGVTTFTPFVVHDVRSWHRVGVIGIGGLGHMALMWAKAMGNEVHAFTTSADKEKQAREFGAHHVHVYKPKEMDKTKVDLKALEHTFDFLLVTIPYPVDCKWLAGMLKPTAAVCFLAGSSVTVGVDALLGQRTVCGSNVGSRLNMKRMLEFASRHKILPMAEFVNEDDTGEAINTAFQRVRDGKARYRIIMRMKCAQATVL